MKDMVYASEKKVEVLHKGEYLGRKFVILSLGNYPVAYVECKERLDDYDDERLYDISVHCGFSYYGFAHWDEDDHSQYLGWDYGHLGDYCGWEEDYPEYLRIGGKAWTTEEIYEEVKEVISQLNELFPLEEKDPSIEDKIKNAIMHKEYSAEEMIFKVAEYEQIVESGLFVKLPCKIGDTAYCIYFFEDNCEYEMLEEKVSGFEVRENEINAIIETNMIGKFKFVDIFYDKELCLKRLRELGGCV